MYLLHTTSYQYIFVINTVIIDDPDSVNAVDGTKVQFSCVVVAEEIDYFVNGTRINQPDIIDAGFIESEVNMLNDTTLRLNLTATALSQYNNTRVQCRGLNTVDMMTLTTFSEVAVLLVQGKLITTYSLLVIHLSFLYRSIIISC